MTKKKDSANISDVEIKRVGKTNGDVALDVGNGIEHVNSKEPPNSEKTTEDVSVVQPVGVCEYFRFAKGLDVFLIFVGILVSLALGAALPLMLIIFGDAIDIFLNNNYLNATLHGLLEKKNVTVPPNANISTLFQLMKTNNIPINNNMGDFLPMMQKQAIYFCIIGAATVVLGYLQIIGFVIPAGRQAFRIRNACFSSIMRQEIGWFDTQKSGDLNSRLSADINKVHGGLGDKIGQFFQWSAACIGGLITGFVYGWKLTLVTLSAGPIMAIGGFVLTKLTTSFTEQELRHYGKAGAVAQEVLGAIRTVFAFGGEKKDADRYASNLTEARNQGIKKGFSSGLSIGFVWFIIFAIYSLGFWYGSKLIREEPEHYTAGRLLIVFFNILIAAMALGQATPNIQAFSEGRGAARSIFAIIDRESLIDYTSPNGNKPTSVDGTLQFKGLKFNYPTRPEVPVLDVEDLVVPAGKTVALVGASGSGKSTIVGLVQRFYNPLEGQVMLDGQDIRDLNLEWYRRQLGIVSQEPVLFACSIAENIRYGKQDVSQADIEAACKMSNIHDFIVTLPDGYDTVVGDRGAQLSGGQKQRVAIARALVRNPKILLLDEATSALDTESESLVQAALDRAGEGRTTLVIAHRLSTVRNADLIVGMETGRVLEVGSHDELMAKKGIYHTLVNNQTRSGDSNLAANDEEDNEIETQLMRKRLLSKSGQQSADGKAAVAEEDLPDSIGTEEQLMKELEKANAGFFRLMKLNASEWPWILLGCLGAIINGGLQPAFAVIFADLLTVLMETDVNRQKEKTNLYSLLFLGLGLISFVSQFLQVYMFARSGEDLTRRCRDKMFRAFLRQDVSFFDWPSNNLGALTTRLSSDAALVQGAAGVRLGTALSAFAALGSGIVIAFIYSWKLALVIIAFVPILVLGGLIQMIVMSGFANRDKSALEAAGKVAVESIENMRCVAGLQLEPTFIRHYMEKLSTPHKVAMKQAHVQAFGYGITQGATYFANAVAFYYGAVLIRDGESNFNDVFKVFAALVFGAMAVGNASGFAPDVGKAQVAAKYLFWLIDRKPLIDMESDEGQPLGEIEGRVSLRGVRFRYPTRPKVPVLRSIDIDISPGQRVALVGSSGCGKSTVIQLLERFYDPLDGALFIDDHQISDVKISDLRNSLSLVSQEPMLFGRTVAENIAYGDNTRTPTTQDIISAARQANIHDFIASLPDGYDTMVGEKGAQLSGGQKQRVAIARALVRNPKILLLDEATSALDTESEKVVQEALDNAQIGRTCIVIAHRLSTIRDADKIVVIHQGHVREVGVHNDLMNKRGLYFNLVNSQANS